MGEESHFTYTLSTFDACTFLTYRIAMVHETLSQADYVINTKLGGVAATARLLGHRNNSTVQGWLKRGFIPGRRQGEVLMKAREAGRDLTKQDFVVHLQDVEVNATPGPVPSQEQAA